MTKNPTPSEQASNIVKWVRALQSGKYRKTTGVLRRENRDGSYKYCCLGVACEIFELDPKFWDLGYRKLVCTIGLNDTLGEFRMNESSIKIHGEHKLAYLNDSVYPHDDNFNALVKDIIDNYKKVFRPEVAKFLRKSKDGSKLLRVSAKKTTSKTNKKPE